MSKPTRVAHHWALTAPGPIWMLGLALLGPTLSAQSNERALKGKLVRLRERVTYQRTADSTRSALGESIELAGVRIAIETHPKHVLVGRGPGQKPTQKVAPGKTFRWSADHTGGKSLPPLAFLREANGDWFVQVPIAVLFRFGKLDLRLVDSDFDGTFEVGVDSYLVGDHRVAQRLEKNFSIGTVGIEILELAPNGSKLRVRTAPMSGSKEQLAAIVAINGLRARHGLAPVVLDSILSKGCTEHATYLQRSGWTGRTNPHSQIDGAAGATAAGAQAAVRAVISSQSVVVSVHGFWPTFYHRIDLMSPNLLKVGINASPTNISVIDVAQHRDADDLKAWPFAEPIFVPADGSRQVLTHAVANCPKNRSRNSTGAGCR